MRFLRFFIPRGMVMVAVLWLGLSLRLDAAGAGANGVPRPTVLRRVVVDKISLQVTNQNVLITGRNLRIAVPWAVPSGADYLCVVRRPFAQPRLQNGFIQSDAGFHVLPDYAALKSAALPRFAFFDKRAATIGLIAGHAAVNGDSVQTLYFIDVENGACLAIPLTDGEMPEWLDKQQFPPPFVTHRWMGFKGWRRSCLAQAYHFVNGRYERDLATEQALLAREFHKLQLSDPQREELRNADASILDNWTSPTQSAQALGDFIYYGTLTGNEPALDDLLATLKPELRASLAGLRGRIYRDSRVNLVTGTVAPAPSPLGDNIRPPHFQKAVHIVHSGETLPSIAHAYGLTEKDLLDCNPGLDPRRLRVGQKVFVVPAN